MIRMMGRLDFKQKQIMPLMQLKDLQNEMGKLWSIYRGYSPVTLLFDLILSRSLSLS